ncbi:MAG: DNA methylase [Phycisphaeraceae bacterium]|nr:DNA methylase [Phycisphaeraceae bacterium]MCB9847955.1 DNA methylase [Phycisphaeraceae bacterium]
MPAPRKPSPGPGKRRPRAQRFDKPPITVFPSTLWTYPSQHYGDTEHGDKNYAGATPSWVIWQLLTRYTREGDRVVDPMCGSGTTIDVAGDLGRTPRGFDINPTRDDVERADARQLPLPSAWADFVFIDPPYSTHIDYSDEPGCIGRLDASEPDDRGVIGGAYYDAMRLVIAESHRVLKNRRYLGLYVSDSYRKRKPGSDRPSFCPVGFELFAIMRESFKPIDIIAVVRGNQKLERGNWRRSAVEENFFLRGFNYCFIMKKEEPARPGPGAGKKKTTRKR